MPKILKDGVVSTMTEAEETAYNQVQTAHNNLYKQYKVDRTSGFYNEDTNTQTKTIYGLLTEQLDMLYRDIAAGNLVIMQKQVNGIFILNQLKTTIRRSKLWD